MAVTKSGGEWIFRQSWREERLRYEVLEKLYEASQGRADLVLQVSGFTDQLGVWRQELYRGVEFLDRNGYLTYHGPGPEVSITPKGVEYVERMAARRRSIRE